MHPELHLAKLPKFTLWAAGVEVSKEPRKGKISQSRCIIRRDTEQVLYVEMTVLVATVMSA